MIRIIIAVLLIIITLLTFATFAYASVNNITLQEVINTFIRYDFDTVKEVADRNISPAGEDSARKSDGLMAFEPMNVSSGWLYDLAGGGLLQVEVGSLQFNDGALSERYIDIKGANGQVRLLSNSFSSGSEYNKTQFWSAKQQEGASIVKGSSGEVKNVVLFEMADGSSCLYGYIGNESTNFWSIELPEYGYYLSKALKMPEPKSEREITIEKAAVINDIDMLLSDIMSSPSVSSRTGDYIKEHRKSYDLIVAMGEEALPYLMKILNSGDKGLRGNIVVLLCESIVEGINDSDEKGPDTEKLTEEAIKAIDNWRSMMGYTDTGEE